MSQKNCWLNPPNWSKPTGAEDLMIDSNQLRGLGATRNAEPNKKQREGRKTIRKP
jgi:hypothetical protein